MAAHIENPNEYDDDDWSEASSKAIGDFEEGITALWEAGASLENIEQDIQSAFENAGDPLDKVQVSLL